METSTPIIDIFKPIGVRGKKELDYIYENMVGKSHLGNPDSDSFKKMQLLLNTQQMLYVTNPENPSERCAIGRISRSDGRVIIASVFNNNDIKKVTYIKKKQVIMLRQSLRMKKISFLGLCDEIYNIAKSNIKYAELLKWT